MSCLVTRSALVPISPSNPTFSPSYRKSRNQYPLNRKGLLSIPWSFGFGFFLEVVRLKSENYVSGCATLANFQRHLIPSFHVRRIKSHKAVTKLKILQSVSIIIRISYEEEHDINIVRAIFIFEVWILGRLSTYHSSFYSNERTDLRSH